MEMNELMALMDKKEDLHPDLEPWIQKLDSGALLLNAPLIQELFYNPQSNALINARYARKQELIEKYRTEKDWSGLIYIYERPYRTTALLALRGVCPDEDFFALAAGVWIDSENLWQHIRDWKKIWKGPLPQEVIMDADEKKAFDALPTRLTIYRGGKQRNQIRAGMSWTLSKEKAAWFAKRYRTAGKKAEIATATVWKEDVIAYFNGRKEQEIVIYPEHIQCPVFEKA